MRFLRVSDDTVLDTSTGEFVTLPTIITFEADRTTLIDETPATISWRVDNATRVILNGLDVNSTGELSHWADETTEFRLEVDFLGEIVISRSLTIDVSNQPPEIIFFDSSKHYGIKGFPIELSWEVNNARRIILEGFGEVTNRNSQSITVHENGVFRLTVEGNFNTTASKEVAIVVIPTPIIETLLITTPDFRTEVQLSNINITIPTFDLHFNQQIPKPSFIELSELFKEFSKKKIPIEWNKLKNISINQFLNN